MLLRHRLQLGLPRQVVSCYLLFCMVAVTWLSLGIAFVAHAVLSSRTEGRCLSQIGKAATAIEIHHLSQRNATTDKSESLAELVARIHGDSSFLDVAFVDPAGTYVAHTDSSAVGTLATPARGQGLRWGEVEATRLADAGSRTLLQFRTPLYVRNQSIGSLWVTAPAPNFWTTALAAAELAPLAILVPLALVGLGSLVLLRITQPVADIHQQLTRIGALPATICPDPTKVSPKSSASLGWNRLVDAVEKSVQSNGRQDIVERVATALQSRKSHDSLHVLDSISDGLAVTDATGRITFANRAIAALLGDVDEEHGRRDCSISQYLAGQVDNPDALEVFADAPDECPVRTEVTRSCGDRQRILRLARGPLHAGPGHVWSLRDVTQQKLAEAMRNQFIDSATHELRTPLANIKAYSETLALMDGVDVEQQKEFCNTINSEATRLARFVDDLLSVSSMEVGSLSIHRQNVDLARLFSEVVETIRPLTQKKSQEFEVHLSEKLGEAWLDKGKIAAMLVNLLGNASKYTPDGGRVAMHVKIAENMLSVSIEDAGVGIAAEELPHIFEKFFRSQDPRVQAEAGTGLGLSLAREIVRLHGGELTVQSTLNEGSTFTATIPLQQEARL